MNRRIARRARRATATGIGIMAMIFLILGMVFWLRLRPAVNEMAQARAILREASAFPDADPTESQPEAAQVPPEGASIDELNHKHASENLPGHTERFADELRPAVPWFGEHEQLLIDILTGKFDRNSTDGPLAPDDEPLDLRAHSQDEVRATVCARVMGSPSLRALRTLCRSYQSSGRKAPRASAGFAASRIRPCIACELADGHPEEAAEAYLDMRAAFAIATPPNDIRLDQDDLVQDLLDGFPGSIPEPLSAQLGAALTRPFNRPNTKQSNLRDAATRVELRADQKLKALKDAWNDNVIFYCITPTSQNVFRRLLDAGPAEKLLALTARAHELTESPPYIFEKGFRDLRASVGPQAEDTLAMLRQLENDAACYHRHLAMSALACTAIALKQYKADHGAYPDSLNGLTPAPIPAPPLDPFTGQSMIYAKDGDGFTIRPPSTKQVGWTHQPSWKAQR